MPSIIGITLLTLLLGPEPADFDKLFTGKTLRFDYYHTGWAKDEHVSLHQIRLEGDWPGSRTHLLDDTNLGKFFFVVSDLVTQRVLYSRGFASIYGEWETTGEARRGVWRTFHESQRFPEPRARCQLTLKRRAADGAFKEIYSAVIDPTDRFVNRSPLKAAGEVQEIFLNGACPGKLDLLILGDGYSDGDKAKFRADAERLTGVLFATKTFGQRREDFNVRLLFAPSERSGVTDPRGGFWNETPLGLRFNAFDLDRYMLTLENHKLRELAALAPYDALLILANTDKYGGGGIFNLWATCGAGASQAPYVFVHELGHSLAGLADEYYTSRVAYEEFNAPGVEPWEPNVTALLAPEKLKWRHLVEEGTPLPTPWKQEEYDKTSHDYQAKRQKLLDAGAANEEMDELYAEVKNSTGPMLAAEAFAGKVGAFEGASYQAKGLYRPEVDCIMFSRNPGTFCRVCSQAIQRVIRLYGE